MQNNPATQASQPSRKIILAVMHATSRHEGSLPAALEAAGYEVFQSTSAVVALEILRMMVVDLVVTEVDLPQMSGVDFACHIRALPRFRQIPIVLLATTTSPQIESELLASWAGATTWVEVALSHERLVAKIAGIFANQAAIPRATESEFLDPRTWGAGLNQAAS